MICCDEWCFSFFIFLNFFKSINSLDFFDLFKGIINDLGVIIPGEQILPKLFQSFCKISRIAANSQKSVGQREGDVVCDMSWMT